MKNATENTKKGQNVPTGAGFDGDNKMNATMKAYTVLSVNDILRMAKVARAAAKKNGGDKTWCFVLRDITVAPDSTGEMQIAGYDLFLNKGLKS